MEPIKHSTPRVPQALRVLIEFESTGWFDTTREEKETHILPKLKKVMDIWKNNGSELLGTIDRDIFAVGHARDRSWHAILIYNVPDMQTVTEMTNAVRDEGLDRYFRFEATFGRPFFPLEDVD